MSLDAEVGAKVELGEFSLRAVAGLGAKLDGIHARLRDIASLEESYQFGPVHLQIRQSGVTTSGGATLVLDLGGPAPMRKWQIHRLAIGGALWSSTVGGTALIVSSPASGQTTPALPDIVDQASTLPSVAFYSAGQIVIRNPSHLFAVFLTPTGSTTYSVGGSGVELPDRRERAVTTD